MKSLDENASTQDVFCSCYANTTLQFPHRRETILWAPSRKWRSWWKGLGLQIRTINPQASGRWKASCTSRRNVSLSSPPPPPPPPLISAWVYIHHHKHVLSSPWPLQKRSSHKHSQFILFTNLMVVGGGGTANGRFLSAAINNLWWVCL